MPYIISIKAYYQFNGRPIKQVAVKSVKFTGRALIKIIGLFPFAISAKEALFLSGLIVRLEFCGPAAFPALVSGFHVHFHWIQLRFAMLNYRILWESHLSNLLFENRGLIFQIFE